MSLADQQIEGEAEDISRYPLVLRLLHWTIAFLLIAQYTDAWTMPHIGRGTVPVGLIAWHIFFGTTILALMIARVAWRAGSAVPMAPANLPKAAQILSRVTHYILYFAVIFVAILGWANASSRGWHLKLFAFVPLPSIMHQGSALGHRLGDIHHTLANALLYLVGFHVAAALYHVIVLRDRLHRRMI